MLGFANRLMARTGLAILGAVCAFMLLACSDEGAKASGPEVEESRDLPTFTRIIVDGAAGLEIKVGEPQSVVVEANQGIMDDISTVVEDGTLKIRIDQDRVIWGDNDVGFKISVEKLEGFALEGAGGAQISGVDSDTFELSLDGAGGIEVSGKCDTANYSLDGAGGMDASGLECKNVTISMDGAGGAEVYASEKFVGSLDGFGGISVQGNPSDVTKSVDGFGGIEIQ